MKKKLGIYNSVFGLFSIIITLIITILNESIKVADEYAYLKWLGIVFLTILLTVFIILLMEHFKKKEIINIEFNKEKVIKLIVLIEEEMKKVPETEEEMKKIYLYDIVLKTEQIKIYINENRENDTPFFLSFKRIIVFLDNYSNEMDQECKNEFDNIKRYIKNHNLF